MSASVYKDRHALSFLAPQEDVISFEEVNVEHQQNKRHALSMLSIGKERTIHGLHYWTVESATEWFLTQQKTQDLHTMTPYLGSMDRIRYHHALRQLTSEGWKPPMAELPQLFYQALVAPASMNPLDLLAVQLFAHMDELNILKKWDHESQRASSATALASAPKGSWLLRQSSVKESDIIIPRALCFKDKRTGLTQHLLIAHIYGFGYVELNGVHSFQQMPYSDGRAIPSSIMGASYMIPNPPLPKIQILKGSLVDLLHSFQHMIDMDKQL
jgi:hypothetical protein